MDDPSTKASSRPRPHEPEASHPSLLTLAKWLTGRLEHDELLGVMAPHLLAQCPTCRALAQELERRKRAVGHWDDLVAATEHHEALALLPSLESGPLDERLRRVEEDEGLQFWGLCQLLVAKSREATATDPQTALDRARLAVRIGRHLDPAYDPAWVADLRARAAATLGNARRALGELNAAEDALKEAEEILAASGTGNPAAGAEVLELVALLRYDQGRPGDAQQLLGVAVAAYRQVGEPTRAGLALVDLAERAVAKGEIGRAVDLLRDAEPLLRVGRGPERVEEQAARSAVLGALAGLQRAAAAGGATPEIVREAAGLLREVRKSFGTGGDDPGGEHP